MVRKKKLVIRILQFLLAIFSLVPFGVNIIHAQSDNEGLLKKAFAKCHDGDVETCYQIASQFHKWNLLNFARDFYEHGCDGEHGPSCYNLGFASLGVEDRDRRIGYFVKGCSLGVARSCESVGNAYRGLVNDRNSISDLYYMKGCIGGSRGSCLSIGDKVFLESECKKGNANACESLGNIYREEKQREIALKNYKEACKIRKQEPCKIPGSI